MVEAEVTAPAFSLIDEGEYEATFDSIDEIETRFGKSWRWQFNVFKDKDIYTVSGITSAKLSIKSKAYRWLKNILGRELKVGEKIDFDELRGQGCRVIIENRQGRMGEISNVIDVLPMQKSKSKKKTARRK